MSCKVIFAVLVLRHFLKLQCRPNCRLSFWLIFAVFLLGVFEAVVLGISQWGCIDSFFKETVRCSKSWEVQIWILPISKKERPPCWNCTSGFNFWHYRHQHVILSNKFHLNRTSGLVSSPILGQVHFQTKFGWDISIHGWRAEIQASENTQCHNGILRLVSTLTLLYSAACEFASASKHAATEVGGLPAELAPNWLQDDDNASPINFRLRLWWHLPSKVNIYLQTKFRQYLSPWPIW